MMHSSATPELYSKFYIGYFVILDMLIQTLRFIVLIINIPDEDRFPKRNYLYISVITSNMKSIRHSNILLLTNDQWYCAMLKSHRVYIRTLLLQYGIQPISIVAPNRKT